jgi:hypothetical protein
VQCERALGRAAAAGRLVAAITDEALRRRVETSALAAPPAPGLVRGDLTVEASWDTATDLDVAVIDGRGGRISWMGGRAGVTSRGVRDLRTEALGIARASVGDYTIEVSRASTADSRTVTGSVVVTMLGERRVVTFVLPAGTNTVRIARASLTRESQLVPVGGGF